MYMNPTGLSNIIIFDVISLHAKEQNLSNWMAVGGGGEGCQYLCCVRDIESNNYHEFNSKGYGSHLCILTLYVLCNNTQRSNCSYYYISGSNSL